MTDTPFFSEALIIEPGKTYCLECPTDLTLKQALRIQEAWERLENGSKVIILTSGMTISRDRAGDPS